MGCPSESVYPDWDACILTSDRFEFVGWSLDTIHTALLLPDASSALWS